MLSKIGELEILQKIYGEIIITREVVFEYGEPLSGWIKIMQVKDVSKQQLLEMQIGKGESSSIALAREIPGA